MGDQNFIGISHGETVPISFCAPPNQKACVHLLLFASTQNDRRIWHQHHQKQVLAPYSPSPALLKKSASIAHAVKHRLISTTPHCVCMLVLAHESSKNRVPTPADGGDPPLWASLTNPCPPCSSSSGAFATDWPPNSGGRLDFENGRQGVRKKCRQIEP